MATRRRLRIAAGFGTGGRQALLGSMLPTASTTADQQRAAEIQVQAKLDAFKNGDINYAQLEAFINQQKTAVEGAAIKASFDASLQAAKSYEKQKIDATAVSDAKAAAQDYLNGNGSLETAQAALRAAKDKTNTTDSKTAIDKMLDTISQTGFQREVSAKVEGYNAGTVKYEDLQVYLQGAIGKTGSTDLQNKITQAMTSARIAENTTQLNNITKQYSAGQMPYDEAVSKLTALRDAGDQKDPDQIQKVEAAIASAGINEQQVLDFQRYNDWQLHKISDADAMSYFNGRMAVTADKPTIKNLGQYAAAVQAQQDAAMKSAASLARSTASQSSAAAHQALQDADAAVAKTWADFDSPTDKPGAGMFHLLSAAQDDPQAIAEAFAIRKQTAETLAPLAGTQAATYLGIAALNDVSAKGYTAMRLWAKYERETAQITKDTVGGTAKTVTAAALPGDTTAPGDTGVTGSVEGGKMSAEDYVSLQLKLAQKADEVAFGPNSIYFNQTQRDQAAGFKNDSLKLAKKRIEDEKELTVQANTSLTLAKTNLAELEALQTQAKTTPSVDDDVTLQGKIATAREQIAKLSRAADLGTTGASGTELDSTGIQRLILQFEAAAHPNTFTMITGGALGSDVVDIKKALSDESIDAIRQLNLVNRAFNQPFLGSEVAGATNPDGSPTVAVIHDPDNVPSDHVDYRPVRMEQVPAVDSNGMVLSPEQRAFIASRMSSGDTFENAAASADQNLGWWAKTAEAITDTIHHPPVEISGPGIPSAKDLGYVGIFAEKMWNDAIGPALNAANWGNFSGLETATKDIHDSAGAQAFRDFLGGVGGFVAKPFQRVGELNAEQAAADAANPNFDPNTHDGIFNNLMHSWPELVQLFGGQPNNPMAVNLPEPGPAPSAQPTGTPFPSFTPGPDAAARNIDYGIEQLVARANAPDFNVNVPQDQFAIQTPASWNVPFMAPTTSASEDPNSPEYASLNTPPPTPTDWSSWNNTGPQSSVGGGGNTLT